MVESQIALSEVDQTYKKIDFLTNRGSNLGSLTSVVGEYQKALVLSGSISLDNFINILERCDDKLIRKPYYEYGSPGDETYPIYIWSISDWVGNLNSIEFSSDNFLIETFYNNVYITDLRVAEPESKYCGFLLKNSFIATNSIDIAGFDPGDILLNFTKEFQTIYLEFEYPYLMNGTLNENVYDWSDQNKLTGSIPITNIYSYDQYGDVLNHIVLSEPIQKTIAQNLMVRVKYDI